jgi:hypothetical protein
MEEVNCWDDVEQHVVVLHSMDLTYDDRNSYSKIKRKLQLVLEKKKNILEVGYVVVVNLYDLLLLTYIFLNCRF